MRDPNSDPRQKSWHQHTWMRVAALLMLPALVIGLYFVGTRISLQRPVPPEAPAEE